ncbi:MAG TPA: polymer-forming cytoskeletal protein [Candidatus Rubrimentiphilum sp.]|nr:polymer-forming cytoskeletal protein [Candidatus Rubrimentiphilum sp.]
MTYRLGILITLIALSLGVTAAPASAKTLPIDRGGTYTLENVYVAPGQVVQGDITVFGGNAIIEGEVDGDVAVYVGTIQTGPGAVINGSQHVYGGDVGSIVPWAAGASTLAAENAKITTLLAYSFVVVLIFLIFPVRVRTALDRVEKHPGLSAAVGVLALIAFIPIAVLLFISFIGWPLIPLEVVAIVAGVLIGQAALGLLIGRRLYELVHPHGTPSPLGALLIGLVVLCAAEILPVVGPLVVALVWTIGLGAAILAFIRETTFTGPGVTAAPPPSGPPMPA